MTKKISVPSGPVGIIFGGSPPEIKTIKESSALSGVASEGEYIVGLIVPGVIEQMGGFDEKSLVSMLKQYSDAKERILILEKDSPSFTDRKTSKVHAKGGGKLGVVFGGTPPVVTDVRDDSPLADQVSVGQVVTGLSVPGKVELEGRFDTHELVSALKANENEEDRILTLTDQHCQTLPVEENDASAPIDGIPPSPRAKPGGTWYIQEFGGTKTKSYGCLGLLCCCLPGLIICCLSLDKRYVYQEPNNGKRFDVRGNQLEKTGKPLHPMPKGSVDPMKLTETQRTHPQI
uniref:Uncharacterized protein n=1 Tax=Minutocellus polymorphus TaxID=265543 RepID=A0A7S0APX9_9STRA|mmetsp:Transcript_1929/g.3221  ORF Transcript_1929/g.3221 Transcript_1929/m.3221 type:complete len:289 (+) Transcript_1929:95-961(+)